MRGKGRSIASVLTDALGAREEARGTALAAAFAEACGFPLSREVSLRGVTTDGRLILVASSQGWADQVVRLGRQLTARVNARLGKEAARGLEVRVGPLDR